MKKTKLLFFLSLFLMGLSWLAITPMWHTPDEQQHFGQVAFLAIKGRNPEVRELDLTKEIYVSEQLLGTKRDKLGNNKFTFHPEYRIEYSNSLIGKYEASISALSRTKATKEFVKNESTRYPLSYYLPASIIYKIFSQKDLFTRVYAIRLFSLFIFIITIYFSYKIGTLIFKKNSYHALLLATLVGFQPMHVFSSIGVTSDSMGSMFFTMFLFNSLLILTKKFRREFLLSLGVILVLSIYTKPQFVILIPITVVLSIFTLRQKRKEIKKQKLSLILITVIILGSLVIYLLRRGPSSIIFHFIKNINFTSLTKFSVEYTLPHTYKEVLPWFWGIFNWLGVTYERYIHRIINRLMFISLFGFLLWIFKIIKNKSWKTPQVKQVLYLFIVSTAFFTAISFYDWLSWFKTKYVLGVQGRYFFPVLTPIALFLLIGWSNLFPKNIKIRNYLIKALAFLMVALNIYALWTLARAYYDVAFLNKFIVQASQYKPWFLKGVFLMLILVLYFVVVSLYLFSLLKNNTSKKSQSLLSLD